MNQAAKALENVLKVQGIKDINITKIKHKHHEKGTNSEEYMHNINRPCKIRSSGLYLLRLVQRILKKIWALGWSEKYRSSYKTSCNK